MQGALRPGLLLVIQAAREDVHNRPDSQSKLVNKVYCERGNVLMPNT